MGDRLSVSAIVLVIFEKSVDSSKKWGGGIICGVNIYNIFVKGEGNGSNQKRAWEYGV